MVGILREEGQEPLRKSLKWQRHLGKLRLNDFLHLSLLNTNGVRIGGYSGKGYKVSTLTWIVSDVIVIFPQISTPPPPHQQQLNWLGAIHSLFISVCKAMLQCVGIAALDPSFLFNLRRGVE